MATINELEYYCKEENSFGALLFTGKWGCGKIYLIDHELVEQLGNEYIIIRISLFGETSTESIKQKVQKAYFQKLIVNMGDYVEDIAQHLSGMNEEKAANVGDKTDQMTQSILKKSDKLNAGKMGGMFRFITGIVKKFPEAEKMLSLNPSEYVTVESTIGNKKVILVFDDLERCNLNEVDTLGCINEYCENKKIKTIIVANEEKIKHKSLSKEDRNGNEEEKSREGLNNKLVVSSIKINPELFMTV